MDEIGSRVHANKGIRRLNNIHVNNDCCCFCLSTRMGALIIGFGLIFSFLAEVSQPNALRAILKLAGVVPFVMVLVADSAWYRQLWLFMFCVTQPLIAVVNMIWYKNILVDSVVFGAQFCWLSKKWYATMGGNKEYENEEQECNDADDDEQNDCEANLDQCPALPGGAMKVLFVITPLVLILNVHFAVVLYVHFKNSRKTADEGGCGDADGPEYEDFNDE